MITSRSISLPRQNPFYCALPYNDKAREGHRPEAPKVVPWFKEAYRGPGVSVCKGRWVEIRKGNRTVYAQWEDAGPFRTDHWEYVFGNERPKPNLNRGAGLDVSPAVRDYLGLSDTDVTDWKFVEFSEVPPGPWAKLGNNNTFVINQRKGQEPMAKAKEKARLSFVRRFRLCGAFPGFFALLFAGLCPAFCRGMRRRRNQTAGC